jgi:hypothetical protein
MRGLEIARSLSFPAEPKEQLSVGRKLQYPGFLGVKDEEVPLSVFTDRGDGTEKGLATADFKRLAKIERDLFIRRKTGRLRTEWHQQDSEESAAETSPFYQVPHGQHPGLRIICP